MEPEGSLLNIKELYIYKSHPNIIHPPTFWFSYDLFSSGFPTNNLYTFFSLICASCLTHLILLDFVILIILGQGYN
jgi:hypothetical protein